MNDSPLASLQALLEQHAYTQAAQEAAQFLRTLPPFDPRAVDMHELAGEAHEKLGNPGEAARHFLAGAWRGGPKASRLWRRAGYSLSCAGDDFAATQAYYHALALQPGDFRAANNLLGIQRRHKRYAAVQELARYLGQQDASVDFLARAALVLDESKHKEEAFCVYAKALRLSPDDRGLIRALFHLSRDMCDFASHENLRPRMVEFLQTQPQAMNEDALQNIRWHMDEACNARVARLAMDRKRGTRRPLFDHQGHVFGPRLRIGYVSADFKRHAVLTAMIGFFEHHDRQRFEVFAYSNTTPDNSELRQRFLACVDQYVSIRDMDDEEAARRIAADQIDILVDLQGHTTDTRLPLFEHGPAPIQVAWLGYPGTTGSEAMHYVLTDPVITPDSSKPHYTEKLCRLPETFFCTDNTRAQSTEGVTRAAEGLPADGLVLCCFNNAYKFDAATFTLWLKALRELPGSVLWVREPVPLARDFLRQTMRDHGVAPERLIFARRAEHMEHHLARLALADLGLDTRIYNGHSMTADTLWAGVPVLTLRGEHFASRVAESLLRAVGLEELVAATPEALLERILFLGRDRAKRQALRRKLARNRVRWPLFDTERLTRHVERAYTMMAQRASEGLAPDHMDVPPLPVHETTRGATSWDKRPPFMEAPPVVVGPPLCITPETRLAPQDSPVLRYDFGICPLCASKYNTVALTVPCDGPSDIPNEVPTVRWLECQQCHHVYNTWQYTPEGLRRLRALYPPCVEERDTAAAMHQHRAACITHAALQALQRDCGQGNATTPPLHWVEVEARADWTARMAQDVGFHVVMHTQPDDPDRLTARQVEGLERRREHFICAQRQLQRDAVIHFDNVLDRVPYPALWLVRAKTLLAPDGVLLISSSQLYPSLERMNETAHGRCLLSSAERLHLFTLTGLRNLVSTFFPRVRCIPLPFLPATPGCDEQHALEAPQWLLVATK